MDPNDVVERYKEVKKLVDQMDEEEISSLAEQVAELASTIGEPFNVIVHNVVSFFEQKKISPEARLLGIRMLVIVGNMRGRIVSAKLAYLLGDDLDNAPQNYYEESICEYNTCNELAELIKFMRQFDSGHTQKICRAAAMKAVRIAPTEEQKEKFSRIVWEEDTDSVIMEIDTINDTDELEQLINRPDVSNRVRRAAAMKAYRLAESTEDKMRFAMLKEKYSD